MPTITYQLDVRNFGANSYTTGVQTAPTVLAVDDGDFTHFVVAYNNSVGPSDFQMLDLYFEHEFPRHSYPWSIAIEPFADAAATDALGAASLTQLVNGNVVAVWDDNHPTSPGVVAAIFDEAGALVRSEFNLTDDSWDAAPQVAALAGGGFAVTFVDRGSIYLEIFDHAGDELATELRVAARSTTFNGSEPLFTTHTAPVIAALADGGLVVVWTQNSDVTGRDVRASIYDADGSLRAGNIVIDAGEENSQPSVTALPGGGFAVAYVSVEEGNHNQTLGVDDNEIFARIFDANGAFVSEIDVSDPPNGNDNDASDPSVATLENGFIVVAWTNTHTQTEVQFRLFDQNGAAFAIDGFPAAFSVPIYPDWTGVNGSRIAVAGLESGRFVAVWQDTDLNGDDRIGGAISEIIRTTSGDGSSETLSGDALRDVMHGLGGVDTLNGEGGDDELDGGELGDTLSGGDGWDLLEGGQGDDTLFGGAGDDVLSGGQGGDTLNGGAGYDAASYVNSPSGVVLELGAGGSGGDAQGDVFVSIERVDGSSRDDQLTGSGAGETLEGLGGADFLRGGGGSDTLGGGEGDDTLYGDTGGDFLYGDSGHDTVRYDTASTTGPVRVDLDISASGVGFAYFGDEGDPVDRMEGVESVVGSNYDDMLYGRYDLNDTLSGGDGEDILDGRGGADRLIGGEDADTLHGGAGSDKLYGGEGDDTLHGDAGNDELRGGDGADVLDGGADFDVVFYSDSKAGVVVNLRTGVGGGGDALVSIEGVVGSDYNDELAGNADDNMLDGGARNDMLSGGVGADTFVYRPGSPMALAGDDVVTDFSTLSGDRIDLSDWGPAYDTFAEVMKVATQVRNDVVFDFGAQGSLTLRDVKLGALTASDFILAHWEPGGPRPPFWHGVSTDLHHAWDAGDRFETFLLPLLDRFGDGVDLF